MADAVLDDLFDRLSALDADPAASVRAEKLACEGKLKHPNDVTFALGEDGLSVVVTCEHDQVVWDVEYVHDGRFRLSIDFTGRSDGRIGRVLKALGEIHRRPKRPKKTTDPIVDETP